ncbi:DNA-directed RNA polymerase subunit alpha [candidate division Kazan bacterium]|uniref:DNA-directed RNA polymerase subunit alpha n=1 Tax=candidate division Kazan bacterium TaxID=2202143 RepID=A0A420ZDZ2_UNCK3|nr:MAG: DNA-directed RNA polymerase subunit alpha [candidate division Kazan bacterium]
MTEAINIPNIKLEEKAINRSVFVVEPFFPGYGTTIGNALRRVLLSSLPGAAVIAVKINGVDHEFSPVPGVKEDAVQIILNLKKLRFKLHEEGPVTLKLKVSKSGVVKASHITLPSSVELMNPDIEIAHVSDAKAGLAMEIQVDKGRGYMPSSEMDDKNFSISTIAVDASFSPVQKVAFTVEPTRVGEVVNYDKLTIDILTDGTITPEEALKQSAQILVDQLGIFGATPSEITVEPKADKVAEGDAKDFDIEEINLSVRTANALKNNGIKKVGDILSIDPAELQELKGLGAKALDEITSKLNELGLKFKKSREGK